MSEICPSCKTLQRNKEIYNQHLVGHKAANIAKEYGISRNRVLQIIQREQRKQHIDFNPWSKQNRDEHIAMFGTWAQKVCLLLPHLKAIKAIAEEKNTC